MIEPALTRRGFLRFTAAAGAAALAQVTTGCSPRSREEDSALAKEIKAKEAELVAFVAENKNSIPQLPSQLDAYQQLIANIKRQEPKNQISYKNLTSTQWRRQFPLETSITKVAQFNAKVIKLKELYMTFSEEGTKDINLVDTLTKPYSNH